jgi:two-component system, chemotaxis family, CheB/CheR fusion protein
MTMETTPAEFQRQLRGLFAVLRTLVRETTQGRESVEDYAARLEGRIGALARVHEMLMRAPAEGVDLQEIVCAELLAQAVAEVRYRIEGPEIRIARDSATSLALVFHELTLNALEHGVLTSPDGWIEATWRTSRQDGTDWLQVHWSEHRSSGEVTPRAGKGFGWELIERMLPYELSARTRIEWAAEGIRVELFIPAFASVTVWRTANDEPA